MGSGFDSLLMMIGAMTLIGLIGIIIASLLQIPYVAMTFVALVVIVFIGSFFR